MMTTIIMVDDDGESSFVLLVIIITTVCPRTVVGDPPYYQLALSRSSLFGLHAIMQMREKRGFISASHTILVTQSTSLTHSNFFGSHGFTSAIIRKKSSVNVYHHPIITIIMLRYAYIPV